ncbi:MAG: patatin-like phospholipase family protein [Campylobacterales bacterium]|nr:patatin-like phospholipase family protein [Campylobacterales bacterium]
MRLIALLLLCTIFVSAAQRPKIALVLSGGGARGGAHAGVLKVLEEQRIPVDLIIGTSMGSFVGGLYASGKTPQEIMQMLETTPWQEYIRTDFQRQEMPLRKKQIDYKYQGRLGLGVNSENELVLPTGVLKRQPLLLKFMELTADTQDIDNFDDLNIPYRAIATNIKNGDSVILDSGSLAKAMYASSSIPGGFQPINIDGIDLVDGGVSLNFPIEVAKEMGADVVIAVDVSENFDENLNVDSYFVVMGQLVNILMRKNANESITKLSANDVLMTPNLEGFSGLDADKYAEIIQKGVDVCLHSKAKLEQYALSEQEYSEYKKHYREKHVYQTPFIDAIVIENSTYISDEIIRNEISQKIGERLNEQRLAKDIISLYNTTLFDSVDYFLEKNDFNKSILHIKTTPSWDTKGEIRFALGLEDDFKGHSAYSLKFGYAMFGLNSYGGEWRSDFAIGRTEKARTEWFQPLDSLQRFYIKPSLEYNSGTEILPSTLLDPQFTAIGLGSVGNQEMDLSRYGGTFAAGIHLGRDFEFEVGLSAYRDYINIDILKVEPLPSFGVVSSYHYDARPLYAAINVDSLDNVNFPTQGLKTELKWTKEMEVFGSDYAYEQVFFDIEKPLNFYANNFIFYARYGYTYKEDDVFRIEGLYKLGGLFNLSGYAPYSFAGNNVALAVLKYTYEIKDGGFFGTLNAPLYLGFSLESGKVWDKGDDLGFDTVHKSGTLYVAADTFLGPLYLAYGTSTDGQQSAYLYLGEKF